MRNVKLGNHLKIGIDFPLTYRIGNKGVFFFFFQALDPSSLPSGNGESYVIVIKSLSSDQMICYSMQYFKSTMRYSPFGKIVLTMSEFL